MLIKYIMEFITIFKRHWGFSALAQKSANGVPPYTLYINRKLGRILAVLAAAVGITPNQVSLASFGISVLTLGYFVLAGARSVIGSVVGVVLLLFAYALDSADGQLARLTGMKSTVGMWLDHVLDSFRMPAFHMALCLVIYQAYPNLGSAQLYLLLLFGALGSALFFSNELKGYLLGDTWQAAPIGGRAKVWLYWPFDYGVMCLLFLLAPTRWLLPVYTMWGCLLVLFTGYSFWRAGQMLKVKDSTSGQSNLHKP